MWQESTLPKAPAIIMYASFMFRETVKITLIIFALNNLTLKLTDIMNAYIQASMAEKVSTIGPEFSKDASNTAVIARASCGLKSARAAFRSQLGYKISQNQVT